VNGQLGSIFQMLDMTYDTGLASIENEGMNTFQRHFFTQAKRSWDWMLSFSSGT